MKTSLRIRLGLVLALAAALAGCEGPCSRIESINGPSLSTNGVDLTTYVAVGTSLSAAYQSGGVVDRHQIVSFPSLFARQIGKTADLNGGAGTFTQPTMNQDGIPALLAIKSLRPLVVDNLGRTTGIPTNLAQGSAYHNMGIPGALLVDLVDSTHYHASVAPVFRTNYTYFNIIQRARGTVLSQALSLQPTFMSIEYGANEVLGPTTSGAAPSTLTGVSYAQLMTGALNAIHTVSPNTKLAVFNVPDVTSIPYFTTFPAFTINVVTGQPTPLLGTAGPLAAGDLVLLPASALLAAGTGFPTNGANYVTGAGVGNGNPLPESLILRASEVATAQAEIAKINAVVDSVALRPYVAKIEIHDYFADIKANGIRIGGNLYTADFIRGGLFSLDGVHPNDLGYALMANRLIEGVNARFGCTIPPVNPAQYASATPSKATPTTDELYPTDLSGLMDNLAMIFPGRR
jgi:GDSL-like Lipase/Acylhydrolase